LEVDDLEALDRKGVAMAAGTVFIVSLVIVGMDSVEYYKVIPDTRDCLAAEYSRSWDNAVLGVGSTLSMHNSVDAVLSVLCTR
jgi:hypothetical protein